jgi:hypothetical protein
MHGVRRIEEGHTEGEVKKTVTEMCMFLCRLYVLSIRTINVYVIL